MKNEFRCLFLIVLINVCTVTIGSIIRVQLYCITRLIISAPTEEF